VFLSDGRPSIFVSRVDQRSLSPSFAIAIIMIIADDLTTFLQYNSSSIRRGEITDSANETRVVTTDIAVPHRRERSELKKKENGREDAVACRKTKTEVIANAAPREIPTWA
jgi:hypothetical protein